MQTQTPVHNGMPRMKFFDFDLYNANGTVITPYENSFTTNQETVPRVINAEQGGDPHRTLSLRDKNTQIRDIGFLSSRIREGRFAFPILTKNIHPVITQQIGYSIYPQGTDTTHTTAPRAKFAIDPIYPSESNRTYPDPRFRTDKPFGAEASLRPLGVAGPTRLSYNQGRGNKRAFAEQISRDAADVRNQFILEKQGSRARRPRAVASPCQCTTTRKSCCM